MFGFARKTQELDYGVFAKCAGARYTTPKGDGTLEDASRDGRLAIRLDSGGRDWFKLADISLLPNPKRGEWRTTAPLPKDREILVWVGKPYQPHPERQATPYLAHVRWDSQGLLPKWVFMHTGGVAFLTDDEVTHWMDISPPH